MKQLLVLLFSCTSLLTLAQKAPINIIPQPVEMSTQAGSFLLSPSSVIMYDGFETEGIAKKLATFLAKPTGYSFKTERSQPNFLNHIHVSLHKKYEPKLGDEGYSLEVLHKQIFIKANKAAGLYYGIQTLLQLLPKEIESNSFVKQTWEIPLVKITDYPRFKWRGVMLDVSRHFFKKEDVKSYIDEIARLKYNVFHWHLTDDEGWRIEIKSLPKLTQVGAWRVPRMGKFGEIEGAKPGEAATDGGFYTQEDIKEVVRYAQERHVTIVPEIDVPGHSMAAIAAYPEISCTKNPKTTVRAGEKFADWFGNGKFTMSIDNSLNPADEKVYEFLDKVFTEVAPLFPSPYIHVGGDECYKGFWEKDAGCKALMEKEKMHDVEELQGYFMKRVEQILKTKGKKMLGWDEILEGGLAPEATVMSWRGIKGGIEAAKMGHEVVMSPTTFAYLDYMQGDGTLEPPIYSTLRLKTCYGFEPVPDGVDAKYILGGQGNLWTEGVPTLAHAEYMSHPRIWALADVYWSPKTARNWDAFIKRVESRFERSEVAGVNYAKSMYDPIVTATVKDGKLMVTLDKEVSDLAIYYTINDAVPSRYETLYTTPFEVPEGPLTLRVLTYRNNKAIGRMVTLKRADLLKRAGK
jgi:hexosaminidase